MFYAFSFTSNYPLYEIRWAVPTLVIFMNTVLEYVSFVFVWSTAPVVGCPSGIWSLLFKYWPHHRVPGNPALFTFPPQNKF